MNANSRRILERRQMRSTETGRITGGNVVQAAEPSEQESKKPTERQTTKSVPVNTLNLKAAKRPGGESGTE